MVIRLPKSAIPLLPSTSYTKSPKRRKHRRFVPCIIVLSVFVMTYCWICCHASVLGKSMLYCVSDYPVEPSKFPVLELSLCDFLVNSALSSSWPPALPADSSLLFSPQGCPLPCLVLRLVVNFVVINPLGLRPPLTVVYPWSSITYMLFIELPSLVSASSLIVVQSNFCLH